MTRSQILRLSLTVFAIEIIIAVWIFWAQITASLASRGYLGIDSTQLGTWGDSFGVLSSLFTALGFLGVIAGFVSQRDQLKLGQEEQHRQRFDNWYFELLRLSREAREAVTFRHSIIYQRSKIGARATKHFKEADFSQKEVLQTPQGRINFLQNLAAKSRPTFSGVDAFKAAWFEANHFIKTGKKNSTRQDVERVYEKYIHARSESVFGPYFRLVYTILEHIDSDTVLTQDEKYRYGRLLRSQMTSYEVALAGLNGLSHVSKDFDRLVIEFRLLKYLPSGNRRRLLERFYPAEAFTEREV